MRWASAVSDLRRLDAAFGECATQIERDLAHTAPDLLLLFASPHFADAYDELLDLAHERLRPRCLIGCMGAGVIGSGLEIEYRAGISMLAAHLPGVSLAPFHLERDQLPSLDAPPDAWRGLVGLSAEIEPHFILLADSFTFPVEDLLLGLDYAFPRAVKAGGLASGANYPGGHALFCDRSIHFAGVVGVALHGNIAVETIVAQGCRPLGTPMRITRCHRNLLLELEGVPPLHVLGQLYETATPRDRALMQHSLFLGLVMDPLCDDPHPGDFLIRNLIGADPESGALAIGALLHEGQIVQFHLRDAQTAAEDLRDRLLDYKVLHRQEAPLAALLFSCTGRGVGLYGRAGHDSELFQKIVGQLPLAGFFCNGEIGPVAGTTYLHGYTSSFALFRPKQPLGDG